MGKIHKRLLWFFLIYRTSSVFQCFLVHLFLNEGSVWKRDPGEHCFCSCLVPSEEKNISTWSGKGPHVLHLLPRTWYTVELLCTTGWMQPKRTHTMLLPSPWIDSDGLWQHAPESLKYVWLSLSMSKVNGHRLVTKYRGKKQEKEKIP